MKSKLLFIFIFFNLNLTIDCFPLSSLQNLSNPPQISKTTHFITQQFKKLTIKNRLNILFLNYRIQMQHLKNHQFIKYFSSTLKKNFNFLIFLSFIFICILLYILSINNHSSLKKNLKAKTLKQNWQTLIHPYLFKNTNLISIKKTLNKNNTDLFLDFVLELQKKSKGEIKEKLLKLLLDLDIPYQYIKKLKLKNNKEVISYIHLLNIINKEERIHQNAKNHYR